MAKSILGDDPFDSKRKDKDKDKAAAPTGKPPASTGKAAAPAAGAHPHKTPAPAASATRTPVPSPTSRKHVAPPPAPKRTPPRRPTPTAPPPAATASSPPTVAPAPLEAAPAVATAPAVPAPSEAVDERTSASAPADYGPSIDTPPPLAHRHQVLDEVAATERRVFGPALEDARRRVPLGFLWRPWRKLAMRNRAFTVDEFGRDPQVAARFEPALDFLYRRYFRVAVDGIGHLPERGRGLIVANHSGTLPYDGAMLMHAVQREHGRPLRPLVEDFVFHFPYLGTLMNRIGGVRACQENAERLLQDDQLVAVFPEGIKGIGKLYGQRYQLQRFGRGGFIKLALSTDSPIIPTAVVGAEEIHPMLAKVTWLARSIGIPYLPITPTFPWLGPLGLVPLPSKWFVVFGAPLYYNVEYGPEGASDRILVNRLADQVRQRIQEMIAGILARRHSVFRG